LGDKIYGHIKHSAYNPDMHRVELIVAINEKDDPDSIEKLARGEDIPVSMASNVPYDVCTLCGNKAKSPKEYCSHIKEAATKYADDGTQIGMINDHPQFFDISKVHRNADRIAFSLRKVASHGDDVELSAAMAARLGVTAPWELVKDSAFVEKAEYLNKLAAIEKQIEGTIQGDRPLKNAAEVLDTDVGCDVASIGEDDLARVLSGLRDAKVTLGIEDFFKLILRDRYDKVEHRMPEARACLGDVFSSAAADPESFLSEVNNYKPVDIGIPDRIKQVIDKVSRMASLDGADGRVGITIIKRANHKKLASVRTPEGEVLAREYARYKFAFLDSVRDPSLEKLAVLQNFS